MATCRSCGAPIIWVLSTNGKKMPIDKKAKLVFVSGVEGHEPIDGDTVRTVMGRESHFSTCPNADTHRKAPTK